MKRSAKLTLAALALSVLAGPLHAACYADYRARMDNPFRLHYGVIELPMSSCSVGAATSIVSGRLSSNGWVLLQVVSVFDDAGLAARRADAGEYFLRF